MVANERGRQRCITADRARQSATAGRYSQIVRPRLIPEAVLDEIQSGPADDPMRRLLPNCNWLVTVRLDTPLLPETSPRLGDGEAAVLEYSRMHGNLPVVVDDRAARRRAQSLGLKVYGTLSLIAMAAAQGHIASFTTAVQQLKAAGSYVSDDVIDAVRKTLK